MTTKRTLLLAPPTTNLAGGLTEWALVAPRDLRKSHGVDITLARLEEMAAAYDPKVEAAAVNVDHVQAGDAHGWLERIFVRDGILWGVPTQLSDELRQRVQSGKLRRQSAEIDLKHEVTGTWYLTGLALLGAKRSAVKGLPPIELAERRVYVVLDAEPDSDPEEVDPNPGADGPLPSESPDQGKEVTMPNEETNPAESAAAVAPGTEPAAPDTAELAAREARLAEGEARVRLQEATHAVREDLAALGARVTPAMRRAGLEDLLVALKANPTPATVQLSADKRTAPQYDVLVAALRAMPEVTVMTTPQLAGPAADAGARLAVDPRSSEERQVALENGITDDRAVELVRKYPGAFRDAN